LASCSIFAGAIISHTHTHTRARTHTYFLHDYYNLKTDTSIVFNDEASVIAIHQI